MPPLPPPWPPTHVFFFPFFSDLALPNLKLSYCLLSASTSTLTPVEAQLGHHPTETTSSVATTTEGMSLTRPGSWELGKLTQRGSAGSEAESGLERGQEEGTQVSPGMSALQPGPRGCKGDQRLQESLHELQAKVQAR